MSSKKKHRSFHRPSAGAHAKARLLPMPQREASNLALRARIVLERVRHGEADRSLINHISQIVLITGFVTRAGFGRLDIQDIDRVEKNLWQVGVEADSTGEWNIPDSLINELTAVVNEYDRQLTVTRAEIVARASDHLDRLMIRAARQPSAVASSDLRTP